MNDNNTFSVASSVSPMSMEVDGSGGVGVVGPGGDVNGRRPSVGMRNTKGGLAAGVHYLNLTVTAQ